MPLHPTGPDDVTGLIDAYGHTLQALIDLGQSMRDADFDRETDCPGWTVKDVYSHVAGVEASLSGAPAPEVTVPAYAHLTRPAQRITEAMVEARRDTPGPDVVEELGQVVQERLAVLYGADLDLDTEFRGVFGMQPLRDWLRTRVLDIWTHEQDVREALGRPGNLDSPAAAVTMEQFAASVPMIVAKRAGVAPGHTVIFDITGPVVGRIGVRVEDVEGLVRGLPLFTGGASTAPESEGLTTSITLSTQAFARRAAGRRGVDDVHWTAQGDEQIARRVLQALVVTP
ncbi:MAG: maleylpyruvate isomerase family mycothiol-dependent enzyme [Nostocoides sp.]